MLNSLQSWSLNKIHVSILDFKYYWLYITKRLLGVGYAMLCWKTWVISCVSIRVSNALHYWRLLETNVFGTGIGGLRMRSKITHFFQQFTLRASSWYLTNTDGNLYFKIKLIQRMFWIINFCWEERMMWLKPLMRSRLSRVI